LRGLGLGPTRALAFPLGLGSFLTSFSVLAPAERVIVIDSVSCGQSGIVDGFGLSWNLRISEPEGTAQQQWDRGRVISDGLMLPSAQTTLIGAVVDLQRVSLVVRFANLTTVQQFAAWTVYFRRALAAESAANSLGALGGG
jgi:hypothetical protein